MSSVEKRTVSLPAEQSHYIDEQISSGRFASASEVVRAGLHALWERDAAVEAWLRDEVVPVYDATKADPSRTRPLHTAFDAVRKRHAERRKSRP